MALISFAGAPHGGSHKLLPEWNRQPRITPTTIIDHSIVGSALGAWYYFRDKTGIESHFIVRGAPSGSRDGHIWQLMDTGRRADANLDANAFAISIETEDNGDPDHFPWSRAQLASLRWLHAKLRRVHPTIPRRRCPSPRGGGLGYHTMWGAPSAWTPVSGKLLALDTLVPTPDGLRTLRDVAGGSVVFDERGEPCTVTAVFDDLPERAWRIVFDDGLEVLAGGEHQWVTITSGQRKGYFRRDRPRDLHRGPRPDGYPLDWARWGAVRDTDEIASTLLSSDGGHQHTIPVARTLRLGHRDLPVDPYLLGVRLGDGGERDGVITAGLDPDDQLELRRLGVLGRKRVPEGYLVGSADQRLALLQGLMDTDGHVSDGHAVEFTSESEDLADAVAWLASSLGQRVRKAKGEARLRGVSHGPKYRVTWSSTIPCFRMSRKRLRLPAVPSVRARSRSIVRCEPVPVQPMRCLTVDSPNSMYLITDRCLATHNTCPGRPVRVRQWEQLLVPAFISGTTKEEFIVATREELRSELMHMCKVLTQGEHTSLWNARTGAAFDLAKWPSLAAVRRDLFERLEVHLYRLLRGQNSVYSEATQPDNEPQENLADLKDRLVRLEAKIDQLLPPPG
jgi:N-acetylmuramoyl-L-alanine amidase/LAGLIDADG-like domain